MTMSSGKQRPPGMPRMRVPMSSHSSEATPPCDLFAGRRGGGRGRRSARSRARQSALLTADEFDRRLQYGQDLLPEAIRRIVEAQQGSDQDGDVDAAPARGQPVHVLEIEPEGVLVEDQGGADAEDRPQPRMEPFRPERDAEEPDDQEDQDSPDEVMDVQPAAGHDILQIGR